MGISTFRDYIVDDIMGDISGITSRAMFGGHALYRDGVVFGIIIDGEVYFRSGETSRAQYEERGSKQFEYSNARGTTTKMSYWRLPEEIMEDRTLLPEWIDTAVIESLAAKAKKSSKKTKSPK